MIPSEAELIALAREGDANAFDHLVGLHQERVFALAYRVLGNADDAADAQQETFVRAWHSLKRFRGDCAFATWLHRITVNVCLSQRKSSHRDEPLDESMAKHAGSGGFSDSPENRATRAATAAVIRKVLASMPMHYRALLVLREIEGRPFEEIARILGCSEKSARVRASKARRMLRERMEPYLGEEPL